MGKVCLQTAVVEDPGEGLQLITVLHVNPYQEAKRSAPKAEGSMMEAKMATQETRR